MPKEAKEVQEVENTESTQEVSQAQTSELESSQEATQSNGQEAEKNSEKGFFAKVIDKAKEATSELFSTESSQEQKEAKQATQTTQTTQTTPKLKSILKKGVKFTSVRAFLYKGEGEFVLKIGAYPYTIQSGEVFIVPNDKTAQYLHYKEQLFSEITE